MYRITRSIRRSLILATATAAVCGLSLATTPAAHADYVECGDYTNKYWSPECSSFPKDGDAGGVSGGISMYHRLDDPTGKTMLVYFDALGEHLGVTNNSDETFRVQVWVGRVLKDTVDVGPGEEISKNFAYADNQDVFLRVMEDDEDNEAWNGHLVS